MMPPVLHFLSSCVTSRLCSGYNVGLQALFSEAAAFPDKKEKPKQHIHFPPQVGAFDWSRPGHRLFLLSVKRDFGRTLSGTENAAAHNPPHRARSAIFFTITTKNNALKPNIEIVTDGNYCWQTVQCKLRNKGYHLEHKHKILYIFNHMLTSCTLLAPGPFLKPMWDGNLFTSWKSYFLVWIGDGGGVVSTVDLKSKNRC